ncbi:hypothetical protein [Edaphobacter aggregans]|uniref:hypothetical protein n=1 Tax=Edaphobacter aggregans TaxID=570835 RepID=UPI0012F9E71B|nr:hypothetical protein [Edaphobacter aggregans]
MPLRQLALLCCIILGPIKFALAEEYAAVNFPEKPGPHAVGVRVVEQYDSWRNFGSAVDQKPEPATQTVLARPLQTLVWYPAQKSARTAMTMGDYVALMDTEVSFGTPQRTRDGDMY